MLGTRCSITDLIAQDKHRCKLVIEYPVSSIQNRISKIIPAKKTGVFVTKITPLVV